MMSRVSTDSEAGLIIPTYPTAQADRLAEYKLVVIGGAGMCYTSAG